MVYFCVSRLSESHSEIAPVHAIQNGKGRLARLVASTRPMRFDERRVPTICSLSDYSDFDKIRVFQVKVHSYAPSVSFPFLIPNGLCNIVVKSVKIFKTEKIREIQPVRPTEICGT